MKRLLSEEGVFMILLSPFIVVFLIVAGICWYIPMRIRSFFFTRKLYRFFVDTHPEKKVLGEILAAVSMSRETVLASLRDLICFGYVEANVREYLSIESQSTADTLSLLLDSQYVAPHLKLKRVGREYPLLEFSWSGKSMRARVFSRSRGLTLIQRLRLERLNTKAGLN